MKKTIVLDTNFLIAQFTQCIDIFNEIVKIADTEGFAFELIIPSKVLDELAALAGGKRKESTAASAAIQQLKRKIAEGSVKVIKTQMPVDEWIINFVKMKTEERMKSQKTTKSTKPTATETSIVICTNDKQLRENLKKLGVRFIVVQEGKKLLYS
jgi:rRNA-processing protein FCF1